MTSPARNKKLTSVDPVRRQRLASADRREQIIAAAITFFAEEGFDGSTRMLAKALGITQPLIYRYFPTKDDLVREVYERVFAGRWQADWESLLTDGQRPLPERLLQFYTRYTEVVFEREWMRIYLFSGLRGLELNRWWTQFVESTVMPLVCRELRREFDLPSVRNAPLSAVELEILWNFQGGIFYYAIRRDIYRSTIHVDFEDYMKIAIDGLIAVYSQRALRQFASSRRRRLA